MNKYSSARLPQKTPWLSMPYRSSRGIETNAAEKDIPASRISSIVMSRWCARYVMIRMTTPEMTAPFLLSVPASFS
ncbi:MAG: hypothetical protein HDT27_09835 [Subdoligranulum sp.]|nr:hypothetical protein [Subdoligranulum sp.]